MSHTATKIPIAIAEPIALRLRDLLYPACHRIEIVGSVRRGKREVGDIELLAIPIMQGRLFGQDTESMLDQRLRELIAARTLAVGPRNGEKWKTLFMLDVETHMPVGAGGGYPPQFDLFIASPGTFGMEMVIRTGPAEFSKSMVTERRFGGYLPDGWKVGDGWKLLKPERDQQPTGAADEVLLDGWRYTCIACPEECDVFRAIGMDWIEPEARQ